MNVVSDYVNYEFWCKENLFQPHERIRCLDFLVKPGFVLYIPPYWFYSIEFQDKDNEVCLVKYTTGANLCANVKHVALFYMQQQNIHEKWWKPLQNTDIDLLPIKPDVEEELQYDVSQNVVEEKTVAEELIDELKTKSL